MKTIRMFAAGLTLFSLIALNVFAEGTAVDGLNGKFDVSGGRLDSFWAENCVASVSLPISQKFGLQADGLYTHVGNLNFEGGGIHLFWRDPEKGLLGFTGGGINGDFLYALQGGLEGQYFLHRFTFGANLSASTLQYQNHAPFIDSHPLGLGARASVSYYPIDNLMIQVGYSSFLDNSLGQISLEYQTPVRGLSCFADLARGEHGYDQFLFGLRFYFGKSKTLIQRHRQDDPPNLLESLLSGIGTYGAEWNHAGRTYAAEHGESFNGGSYGLGSFSLISAVGGSQP